MKLSKPYWVVTEDLPGHDFNKEIIAPGLLDKFPDGVIGIRVDDDFWSVAALPYGEYINKPIEQIVAAFWPDITDAEFGPDVIATKKEIDKARAISEAMNKSVTSATLPKAS